MGMTTTQQTIPDPAALEAFTGHVAGQATAAVNAALVVLGDRLGIWKTLAGAGPLTLATLAERAGIAQPYLREWAGAQVANGYLAYDPVSETYELTVEAAAVLADEDSPSLFIGAFQLLPAMYAMLPALGDAFRTGDGVAWADRDPGMFDAEERFSRPFHNNLLTDVWLAAVPDLLDTLAAGATVADVGCGYGTSTIALARRFPQSRFVGFDFHDHSIARARDAARRAGVADRVSFEVADARSFPGDGYDLVLFCDSLHDMGDPVAAARHAHDVLAPGGRLVTLDPKAGGDSLAENLTDPFAATFYPVSTFICTPAALAQDGPMALGALAGERALRQVLVDGGFTDVERVAHDAPLNMVLVATNYGGE
ncbi:MAG: class I SAM-dependent methyltransferase [Acidimicrobiales bacterium]